MNDRTFKLSATLGAIVLALAAPAVASAQDQTAPDNAAPDTSTPAMYSAPPAPMASQQLDQLQSLGFLNQSAVMTTQVDANTSSVFDPLPSDQLNTTLDNVKVIDADSITYTLREFLAQQGIDPSTIVALNVSDNAVVIGHT